jgi:single-strand DNA-binding protein
VRATIAGLLPSGLSLPVSWLDTYGLDGTSAPGTKNFPLPDTPQAGTPTGIPRACACGAKIRGSGRGAALRLPFARLWRAPALFRLPGHYGKAIATGHSPTRWRKTMRNIAEFTLIGRVGTIKQVGKTLRVSICANYPFKDDKGQWKDDAHWNEVTIFTKAIQSYVSEHVSKGDLVHVRGRLRQNSFERDGQRVYTVDLIAHELGRLAQASERAAA